MHVMMWFQLLDDHESFVHVHFIRFSKQIVSNQIYVLVVTNSSYEICYCVILLILNSVILILTWSVPVVSTFTVRLSISLLPVWVSVCPRFDGVPLGDYSKCQTENICQNVSTLDNLSTTGQITEPLKLARSFQNDRSWSLLIHV